MTPPDPLLVARARIRERLTDDVLRDAEASSESLLQLAGHDLDLSAMRDVLSDALAPDLAAAEARVEALQRDLAVYKFREAAEPPIDPLAQAALESAVAAKQRADALAARLKAWEDAADDFMVVNWIGVYDREDEPKRTFAYCIEHCLDQERDALRTERDALAAELQDAMSSRDGWKDTATKLAAELAALRAKQDGIRRWLLREPPEGAGLGLFLHDDTGRVAFEQLKLKGLLAAPLPSPPGEKDRS